MLFWCYMHVLLFGKKEVTGRSPIKYGDQILRLSEAVHLPAEVSVSHCKGHQKGSMEGHEGTKLPIRQLREQHYRTVT